MANILPSKAPNLINAPDIYGKSYTDNLNNILRLYFNTIDGNNAYILNALVSLQDQIDTLQGEINALSAPPYFSAFQDGVTALTADITTANSTAPIHVTSTAGFPSSGYILIEDEIIGYTTTTSTTFDGTITRGALGSTAGKSAHSSGTAVSEAAAVTSTTSAAMRISNVICSNQITCTVPDTKIYLSKTGIYNIQISVQFLNYSTADDNVTVWVKKNSSYVDDSASVAQVPQKHAHGAGATILAVNFVDSFTAGDDIEIYWASNTGETILATYPSRTTPVTPASPSLIITITYVSSV